MVLGAVFVHTFFPDLLSFKSNSYGTLSVRVPGLLAAKPHPPQTLPLVLSTGLSTLGLALALLPGCKERSVVTVAHSSQRYPLSTTVQGPRAVSELKTCPAHRERE